MKPKKLDWKNLSLLIFLLIFSIVGYTYHSELLEELTAFFKLKGLTIIAGCVSVTISLAHKIKAKKIKFESTMSFNEFRKPFEEVFSFLSNPISVVSSISLAKGLYLQKFEDIEYFPLFGKIEINFLIVITIYLTYTSIMEIIKHCREIIFHVSTIEKIPQAISENK